MDYSRVWGRRGGSFIGLFLGLFGARTGAESGREDRRAGREPGERLRLRGPDALDVDRRGHVQHDAHAGGGIARRRGEELRRGDQRGAALADRRDRHDRHGRPAPEPAAEPVLVRLRPAAGVGPEQGDQQPVHRPGGADGQAAQSVLPGRLQPAPSLVATLQAGGYSDFRAKIVINVPFNATGNYLFDNLHFLAGAVGSADLVETNILQRWTFGSNDGPTNTTLSVLTGSQAYFGQNALRAVTDAPFDFFLRYTAPTPIDIGTDDYIRVASRALNTIASSAGRSTRPSSSSRMPPARA